MPSVSLSIYLVTVTFNMTTYILITITVLAIVIAIALYFRARKASCSRERLRAVVNHQENYTFLVNSDFEVEETNFYARNSSAPGEPNVLGNVLHCKNAHENGRCGEHEACKHCPVRFVITKSFERGDHFRNLEACMELYDKNKQVVDVDVQVEGYYVNVEDTPHMVINVKDVTANRDNGRPKILFISENAALYDKVRESMSNHFRVLHADNEHQALHRLLHFKSYQFVAVITDEDFYGEYDTVTRLLVKDGQVPVYVVTESKVMETSDHIQFINTAIGKKELCNKMLELISVKELQ